MPARSPVLDLLGTAGKKPQKLVVRMAARVSAFLRSTLGNVKFEV